jgi:hypothetical protein
MDENDVDDYDEEVPVDMQTYFIGDKEYGVSVSGREICQTLTVCLTIHRLLELTTASPSTQNKEVRQPPIIFPL